MINKHFTRYLIGYVVLISLLLSLVIWYYFNNQIEEINQQIEYSGQKEQVNENENEN